MRVADALLAALCLLPLGAEPVGAEESSVLVSVTGRAGRPLEGAWVFRRDGERWARLRRTGPRGVFDLPADPQRATWELTAHGSSNGPQADPGRRRPTVPVRGPRVSISIDCGAECTLDVVDAETGDVLPSACWRPSTGSGTEEPQIWRAAGKPAFLLVGSDGQDAYGFNVEWLEEHPATHAADAHELWKTLAVSGWQGLNEPDAAVIRAIVPVRRAITLVVRPRSADGRPAKADAARCEFDGGWVADIGPPGVGRTAASQELKEPADRLELRLPYFRGARLTVFVRATGAVGRAAVRLPGTWSSPTLEVPVRLAPPSGDEEEPGSQIEGGFLGDASVDDVEDPHGSALDLRVLRRDGRPLAHADVRLETVERSTRRDFDLPASARRGVTDAAGRALFRDLPPGRHVARVDGPHALPMQREVDLSQRGATVVLELREPAGARLEVSVVDADRRPLPFARVTVSGPLGADTDVGVDPTRIDPYTDVRGRRAFRRVEPGKLRVWANYGPMAGETVVEVPDGGEARAVVVATQPK